MLIIFTYKKDVICPPYTPPPGDNIPVEFVTEDYTPPPGGDLDPEFCDPNA